MRSGVGISALLLLGVLLVVTGYELAYALKFLSLGRLPGAGPAGSDLVVIAALLSMLIGAGFSIVLAAEPRLVCWPAALLAPAGAAFVAARLYTFDPYYLPTLRRISDGGVVSEAWVFGLVTAAVLVGLCTRPWPALGSCLTALALVICAFTTVMQNVGH